MLVADRGGSLAPGTGVRAKHSYHRARMVHTHQPAPPAMTSKNRETISSNGPRRH